MAPECPSSPVGTSIYMNKAFLNEFFSLSFTKTAMVRFGFDNKGLAFLSWCKPHRQRRAYLIRFLTFANAFKRYL